MNLVIEDGRTRLYQWDTDQRLTVIGDLSCEEVHFCHNGDENALVCRIREEKGVRIVDIPNILLQKDQAVTAYLVFKNDQGMETVWAKSFQVLPRPKPEDYVYTQTEVLNYENLDQRLKRLEEEGIGDAVKEYLAENPIDGSGNLLVVTFTDEDGTLTPSHTYDQIKAWADNGGYAVLTDGNTWYQLFASKSILYFERVVIAESESMLIQYLITPLGGMDKREFHYDLTTGGGSGLSETAKNLLITILRNGVYSIDQSNNITALAAELNATEEEPNIPDEPDEPDHTHSYTSSVTTAATCETAGVRTYTCSCGHSYTEVIPATGHNYVDGVCTVCGATDPNYVPVEPDVPDTTSLIHSFDFTQGLSDSVGGLTATLNGSAIQDSDGVHLTTATDYVGLDSLVTKLNRAYELDMGAMQRSGTTHGRLLAQDNNAGFMYRNSGYWTWWSGRGWCDSTGLTKFDDIANKTIRIEVDASGYHTLYVDGSQIAKSSLPVGSGAGTGQTLEGLSLSLGSANGSSCVASTIRALRVYNLEVTE